MIQRLKNETLYQNVRMGVLVFIVLFALLRQNITALQPILMHNSLTLLVTAVSLLLVLWDLLCFRNCLKAKYAWVLLALFGLTVLAVLLNVKYCFMDNVKAVINMFIQFFAVYTACASLKKERVHRELTVLGAALCITWFLAAAISVYMYFADIFYTQTSTLWHAEGKLVLQGFVRVDSGAVIMRLWGIFLDPNFASCVSIITICLSLYGVLSKGKLWVKILHGVNILVQFLYIVLSNSRMALLILCLCAFVYSWYMAWPKLKAVRNVVLRELVAIVLAVVVVVLCYGAVQLTQRTLPYVKSAVRIVCTGQWEALGQLGEPAVDVTNPPVTEPTVTQPPVTEPTATQPSVTEPTATQPSVTEPTATQPSVTEPPVTQPPVTEPPITQPTVGNNTQVESLDRQDIAAKGDVSNGRFKLWAEGLVVFKTSPVIGAGPRSYSQVAKEVDPTLRIVGYSIHNSFMELLMGNGILGFALMILFFLLIVKDALVLRYRGGKELDRLGLVLVVVLNCLGCGMFISSLFYYLTGMALLSFAMSGYAVSMMKEKRAELEQK